MALLVYIGYRTVAYIHIQGIRSCRRKLWEHTYMLFKGRPQRYLPTPSPYISERPKRCHRVTTFSFGHREVSSARCTDFWGYRHASLNIIVVKLHKYFFIAAVIQIVIKAMYFDTVQNIIGFIVLEFGNMRGIPKRGQVQVMPPL